jgi:hypothetical protein
MTKRNEIDSVNFLKLKPSKNKADLNSLNATNLSINKNNAASPLL